MFAAVFDRDNAQSSCVGSSCPVYVGFTFSGSSFVIRPRVLADMVGNIHGAEEAAVTVTARAVEVASYHHSGADDDVGVHGTGWEWW